MKKVEAIGSDAEPEVQIKVTLNAPTIGAEAFMGVFFKNAPQITISETTLTFTDMKKVMKQHNFKKWEDVKTYIEEKYTEYYLQMFQDWKTDVPTPQKNIAN
jgi:hypothetical protein